MLTASTVSPYTGHMNPLHAHVSTRSLDCDGPIFRDYTVGFNDDERAEEANANGINDFSDIHFMERVMLSVASPWAAENMTVSVDREGIEVHEETDEGYRSASVAWCEEPWCELDYSAYRDIRAEEAGY